MALPFIIAGLLSATQQPDIGSVLRYRDQYDDRFIVRTCELRVESITDSSVLPKDVGPRQTRTEVSPSGVNLDPFAWAKEFQKNHGEARAVLRSVERCPKDIILVYATHPSSLDAAKIAEAGTSIPLGCIPAERHTEAIDRFEKHPGPIGQMILVGLGPRATEGTFQYVGRYDWDLVREQARATQFTMECPQVHPDPDSPVRKPPIKAAPEH